MTTDVSPSATAGATSRLRTSPALLAAVGLYAAAAGHVVAALVHLSHGAIRALAALAVVPLLPFVQLRIATITERLLSLKRSLLLFQYLGQLPL